MVILPMDFIYTLLAWNESGAWIVKYNCTPCAACLVSNCKGNLHRCGDKICKLDPHYFRNSQLKLNTTRMLSDVTICKKKELFFTYISTEPETPQKSEKVLKWIEAVETAPTLSRLHVLLAMFENCVKWEKSAANARCKICRKKDGDTKLLLCDECNQPFHMYCLRPALSVVPKGEWKCPACAVSVTQVVCRYFEKAFALLFFWLVE